MEVSIRVNRYEKSKKSVSSRLNERGANRFRTNQEKKSAKKVSNQPDSNQWPWDNIISTVPCSTNWAMVGSCFILSYSRLLYHFSFDVSFSFPDIDIYWQWYKNIGDFWLWSFHSPVLINHMIRNKSSFSHEMHSEHDLSYTIKLEFEQCCEFVWFLSLKLLVHCWIRSSEQFSRYQMLWILEWIQLRGNDIFFVMIHV